jgi:hypothetical protein
MEAATMQLLSKYVFKTNASHFENKFSWKKYECHFVVNDTLTQLSKLMHFAFRQYLTIGVMR